MIVRMKHLDLVAVASDRERTLSALRELGVVHLDLNAASGVQVMAAKGEIEEAMRAVMAIGKARGKTPRDDFDLRERKVPEILALIADRETLQTEADRLERLITEYAPYGDFDPKLAEKVQSAVGDVDLGLPAKLPEMRLAKLEEKFARVKNRIALDNARLAGADEEKIVAKYPAIRDRIAFEQAKELMETAGALALVSGWVPECQVEGLRSKVKDEGWAILLRDPAEGEIPPTLVEPPKLFRPMKALFDGLGISPGYTEGDVSVPFMCYFSLFFAMLVGDGAYGLIFLIGTIAMAKKLPKAWLTLLTVFSSATVIWGLLSNTWFGAGLPCCADWPTVKWLADPSYHNMMLLCFTIGVSHLMLARIWNGICSLNDSTCVAQFGWAGILLFMYLVTNSIVGIFTGIPTWGYYVLGVSLVAVFGFSVKPSELKTRGAELGMLPLNIMSALGDIISYVRLFAVGLASVKVAENFNSMATGLLSGEHAWYLNALFAVAMVAILVVGHALNLAMAGLSILVHAVRLNTLEFSNHKGVSWSGYAYRAFRRNAK